MTSKAKSPAVPGGKGTGGRRRNMRTPSGAQSASRDLSTSFSASPAFGDIVPFVVRAAGDSSWEDQMQAFVEAVVAEGNRRGLFSEAYLAVVRSLIVRVAGDPRTDYFLLGTPEGTTTASGWRLSQNSQRAQMRQHSEAPLVMWCDAMFRQATNMAPPSPSWRREGIPISAFNTLAMNDLSLVQDARLTFEAQVSFPRSDRLIRLTPVLRTLIPAGVAGPMIAARANALAAGLVTDADGAPLPKAKAKAAAGPPVGPLTARGSGVEPRTPTRRLVYEELPS